MQRLADVLMPGETLAVPQAEPGIAASGYAPAEPKLVLPLPTYQGQPPQSGPVQKQGTRPGATRARKPPVPAAMQPQGGNPLLQTVAQSTYAAGTPAYGEPPANTVAPQEGPAGGSQSKRDYPVPQPGFYTGSGVPALSAPSPGMSLAATAPADQSSMRDEIQAQIAAIDGRNSPFAGTGGLISNRSGQPGFERLADQEISIEGSTILMNSLRVTAVVRPVFLNAGTPDGTSVNGFGTAPVGTLFGSQSASGLAGEVQLSTQDFGLRFGNTPAGFLTHSFVGGARWRIAGGPVTVWLTRDNVKDTLLSYAGVKDPLSGSIWGGVMANTGIVQASWGGAERGFYGSFGYQYLNGTNVATNRRLDGNAGAYWRVLSNKNGALTLGANISAMGYSKNLRYFTYGQGGYFSPQEYLLVNAPIRWVGRYKRNFEYIVAGSIGSQQFHEDPSPFFPNNSALQGKAGPYYPGQSVSGANYNLEFRGNYHLPGNWYLSAYMDINNARDYTQQTFGFSIRYLFHDSAISPEMSVPTIPDWKGFQPFTLQ